MTLRVLVGGSIGVDKEGCWSDKDAGSHFRGSSVRALERAMCPVDVSGGNTHTEPSLFTQRERVCESESSHRQSRSRVLCVLCSLGRGERELHV